MLTSVLLLFAIIQSRPSAPAGPASDPLDSATVRVENQSAIVTVYPRRPRTITSIILQPLQTKPNTRTGPQPVSPRSTQALSEKGVRATFKNPDRPFIINITLDDNTVQYMDGQGRRTGPGPYEGHALKDDMTLLKRY